MELFARRRYYFCRYCGTFDFLESPETDGIRVLEMPAAPLVCIRCSGKLAIAQLDGSHTVQYLHDVPRCAHAPAHLRRRRLRATDLGDWPTRSAAATRPE